MVQFLTIFLVKQCEINFLIQQQS